MRNVPYTSYYIFHIDTFFIKLQPNQNLGAREGGRGDGSTPEVYQKKSGRKEKIFFFFLPFPAEAGGSESKIGYPPTFPFSSLRTHKSDIFLRLKRTEGKKWGEEEGFAEPEWNASAYLKKETRTLIVFYKSNLVGY